MNFFIFVSCHHCCPSHMGLQDTFNDKYKKKRLDSPSCWCYLPHRCDINKQFKITFSIQLYIVFRLIAQAFVILAI